MFRRHKVSVSTTLAAIAPRLALAHAQRKHELQILVWNNKACTLTDRHPMPNPYWEPPDYSEILFVKPHVNREQTVKVPAPVNTLKLNFERGNK